MGLPNISPPLRSLCDLGFQLWSHTRNGLFLAPVFLLLGAHMGNLVHPQSSPGRPSCPGEKAGPAQTLPRTLPGKAALGAGLVLGLLGMTGEAFLLRHLDSLRHDSMYLLLIPVMYCLYGLLLRVDCPACPRLRKISTLVYILHPAVIVAVRICARLPHLLPLMEHSLLHYLAVCLLSLAGAWLLTSLPEIRRKRSL